MPASNHRNDQRHARSRSPQPRPSSYSSRRSRSPRKHRSTGTSRAVPPPQLPCKAQPLSKHALDAYRELFRLYLDVQKQLVLEELDEKEIKGRWKSFIRRWNEGDLAEGWYDPDTKLKADERAKESLPSHAVDRSESDDDVGPSLLMASGSGSRPGPSIPSMHDLAYRNELATENRLAAREDEQFERCLERRREKERLEEMVPKADAGTRERQLEKKRETTAMHASYREGKSPGAEEIAEEHIMGDDGIESYKRKKLEEDKKKTERQLRKEEIWRAKAEERKEKVEARRVKEEQTMDMLRALAKQNYG